MKLKLNIELPTLEKLVAGLAPRDLYPQLAEAERKAADAEQTLERRRRELADRERLVAELPARIQRGETRASALTEALRERDAAALLVPQAEALLAKARERVPVEEKNAKLAVEREVLKRTQQLERAAAEISPVLDELREASLALSRVLHPHAMGMFGVDWTCGLNCTVATHIRNLDAGGAK